MGDKGIKPVLRNTLPKVKYIPPQWDQTVGTAPLSPDNDPLLSLWSQSTSQTDDHSEVPGEKNPPRRKDSPSRPSRLHYSEYMRLAPVLKLLIKAAHCGPRMGVSPPPEIISTFTPGGSECNDTCPVSGSGLQTHERFLAL